MMKPGLAVVVAVFAVVLALAQPVMAADQFGARLRGLEEVPSISTLAQGFFLGTLNAAGTALDYTVVYFDLQGTVTQSHIHIAQPGVNGGIVLFFCTNLVPPAGVPIPPACPTTPGINTVTGTLTSANVITQATQGIAAGEFSEVIRAIRAGNSYANVHTDLFPGGEIRGQVTQ
jgi:CHRD domain-containing protein